MNGGESAPSASVAHEGETFITCCCTAKARRRVAVWRSGDGLTLHNVWSSRPCSECRRGQSSDRRRGPALQIEAVPRDGRWAIRRRHVACKTTMVRPAARARGDGRRAGRGLSEMGRRGPLGLVCTKYVCIPGSTQQTLPCLYWGPGFMEEGTWMRRGGIVLGMPHSSVVK